eukprot:295143_1
MIIGSDFFVKDDNGWIQSVDRSNKLCTKYEPTLCELNVMHQYDKLKTNKNIRRKFTAQNAKQILKNTNLILQHMDRRMLYKTNKNLVIDMSLNIKYKYDNQMWQCKSFHFVFQVGNNFKWKIDRNVTFTKNKIFMSSLWITNNSKINCVSKQVNIDSDSDSDVDENKYDDNHNIDINDVVCSNIGEFKIICDETIIIDENCSISMNGCGVHGAFYKNNTLVKHNALCNGKSGKAGSGAGYKKPGQKASYKVDIKGYYKSVEEKYIDGGCPIYSDDNDYDDNDYNMFSVGFGGGCMSYDDTKQSKGGDGGGKIVLFCNELEIKHLGKITSNGCDGIKCGGGGSGGSILLITNKTNVNDKNINEKLTVKGGKGDHGGGDGSDGLIKFGMINIKKKDVDSKYLLQYLESWKSNVLYKYEMIDEMPFREMIDGEFYSIFQSKPTDFVLNPWNDVQTQKYGAVVTNNYNRNDGYSVLCKGSRIISINNKSCKSDKFEKIQKQLLNKQTYPLTIKFLSPQHVNNHILNDSTVLTI